MRIALFTLDSALSAQAVLDFCRLQGEDIVLIARSDPYRPSAGGTFGQLRAHWRRSGPRILPFLLTNYALPQTLGTIRRALGRAPLTNFARRHNIAHHTVSDLNGPATIAALRAARPDLIVSFHFDQIFTAETLALAPLGGINIHPSCLPHHRGPLPTFWAMQSPHPGFGVTIHRLAPRIDAGTVLAQRTLPLPPHTSAAAAARHLHAAAIPLAVAAIAQLAHPSPACPSTTAAQLLPYCPFPSGQALRHAAHQGHRVTTFSDLLAALRAPTG
jgi:methionyl-tRNA formyltransferase